MYVNIKYYNLYITYFIFQYVLDYLEFYLTTAKLQVLKSWNDRLEMSERDIPLQQVRVCAKLAKMCIDPNKANRPSTHRIIETLELGSADKFDEAGTSTSLVAQVLLITNLIPYYLFQDLGHLYFSFYLSEFRDGVHSSLK